MTGTTKRILIIGASLLLLGIVPALVLAQGSPHNDYFANAEEIFGRSGNVGGSNAGAGIEPGEPTHFGYGNRYSVWYKWTAPVNGTATFTFDSSSSSIYYGIVLGVYTGSSVSELNAVAGGLVQSNSSAVFGVAKGTTYYICVSGCDYWETQYGQNLQGNFVLNWNVEMLTPEVYEWPDSATAIIYGDPLSASTLSGGSASVPGAFEFVDPNYVPPAAGTCSAGVKFVPADQDTYDIVTGGIVTVPVNRAPLTITADDKSKTYGDDDPAFTVSYEGFRRGDTASVVSGLNISREAGENVGQYAITPSGATAGNYTITFVNGTLTINPAPLTITADDKSKVYGDPDPAFTASYDGFKLGDTAGVVSGLAFSREEGEDVGTYTITPYGATASNYAITFESGTLTINKATPLVTAWPQAAPIIYGDMLGSSSLTGGEASVPGSFAFVYPEACPEAGLQSVAVTFIPEDTHNYNSVSGTVEIAVKYMLSINPDTGGSVSGAGEYLPGEEVQIKAEPAVGYRFVCWMEGGAIIGDDAEMSITLSDHRILRAVFWEYDTEKTWSQKDIGTTDNKATVDFHDGKVSMEINSPGEITDGQIDVTLYDADAEKGAPEGMVPAGIYLRIERTDNFAGSTVRLVVKYDPAELPEDVEETSLKLYRFVPGTGWVEVSPQGVNKAEKYIWAELTGFSTFAVFGEVSPSEDLPKTEGTQVYLAVLAALFAIGGLFALLRRKLAKEN